MGGRPYTTDGSCDDGGFGSSFADCECGTDFSDCGTRTPNECAKILADKLAKFKQPKAVFFVEALPRNTMGKVQKVALRAEHKELFV